MEISREAYLERLREDLSRWAAQGRIDPEAVDALLADAAARFGEEAAAPAAAAPERIGPAPMAESRGGRMVEAMFLLAGVLLAAGALSFIAANWEQMSRLARLALIIGGLWASGLFAVWLRGRAPARYAEGMFLLTAALFGGAMALIAQMYHISGDLPRFLLTWSLGALALSALMAAEWAGVLGLLAGLGWSLASVGMYLTELGFGQAFAGEVRVHWPFLLMLLPAALLAMMHRWRWLARASVFAALAWAAVSVSNLAFGAAAGLDYIVLTMPLIGVLAALKGVFLRRLTWPEAQLFSASLVWQGGLLAWFGLLALLWPEALGAWRLVRLELPPAMQSMAPAVLFHAAALVAIGAAGAGVALKKLEWWEAAAPALLAVWLLLVAHYPGADVAEISTGRIPHSWLLSRWTVFGMLLLFSLWLLGLGLAHELRAVWRLGLVLFALTVFWLYVITIGSLLDTASFFLGAGLLLLALAVGGWRFLRWVERRRAGEGAA